MIIKDISYFNWEKKIALELSKSIKKNNNNIILTGGKSVKKIYKHLFELVKVKKKKINIFLTDERCLNISNSNLNANLFKFISKLNYINFFPIILKNTSFERCAKLYEKKVPLNPSFVLLSLAEDGHLASIFFNSKALISKKKVFFEKKIYNGFQRITLTLKYLMRKKIFIVCKDKKRLKAFFYFKNKKNHILNILVKKNKYLTIFVKKNDFKILLRSS
mgnify:CR=1 FL=1|tara:strand:+ start:1946 stop:2602 length:657 start_codon:yes stop_codon:yes gene_type:complete